MKKARLWGLVGVLFVSLIMLSLAGCAGNKASSSSQQTTQTGSKLVGAPGETYYMITFMSGLEYWKSCWNGFSDAGNLYQVKTVYTGAQAFDINQQVTVLNEIVVKHPAGIAITCVNDAALVKPIQAAQQAGIDVICFDSDSPNSGRPSIIQTGNANAGAVGADTLAKALNEKGLVAVIFTAGTPTHEQRAAGFKQEIQAKYPNMQVVEGNYNGTEDDATKTVASLLQAHPDLGGVFTCDSPGAMGASVAAREANNQVKICGFDTDKDLLDAIKSGNVLATIAQGAYNQGYWAMNFLFQWKHQLMNPYAGWQQAGLDPLPPYVDTGVNVVTKDNVDLFYLK